MERDTELEKIFLENLKDFSVTIDMAGDAYKLDAQYESKSITVTWPYPLMEVFFDSSEGEKVFKSESIEFYDGEPVSELHDYVTYIIQNYLNHSTRIETIGSFLKRQELQINANGQWVNVFD